MKKCVVLQSDFGVDSGLVASMHGVCMRVDSSLVIDDITHSIRPFNIRQAAEILQYTIPCWPEGTVFVSVVDPGVGTLRRASVAKTKNGYYIVTPDNGTLTMVDQFFGIEAIREIDEKTNRYMGAEYVNIFHGRDLFAYCAAKLAAGFIDFEGVGPEYSVQEIVRYELQPYNVEEGCAYGSAVGDPENGFGILLTNIPNAAFIETGINFGDTVQIELSLDGTTVYKEAVMYNKAFGDVEIGEPILHPEMASCLGLALNQENFSKVNNIVANIMYTIKISK